MENNFEQNDIEYSDVQYRSKQEQIAIVTIALIAINILVFILCAFMGDLLYNNGDFSIYFLIHDKAYYRLITSLFLHLDSAHIAGNMVMLYAAGELVEKYCGKGMYLMTYFMSGFAGSGLSALWEISSGKYFRSIGASGAVFGLIGALLAIVIVHKGFYKEITTGRIIFMIVLAGYTGVTSENVNNAAHVGGLLAGFALMMIYCFIRKLRTSYLHLIN